MERREARRDPSIEREEGGRRGMVMEEEEEEEKEELVEKGKRACLETSRGGDAQS